MPGIIFLMILKRGLKEFSWYELPISISEIAEMY
jgi:hypothetical protein